MLVFAIIEPIVELCKCEGGEDSGGVQGATRGGTMSMCRCEGRAHMRLPVDCRLNGEDLFFMILFFSLLLISFDLIRYVFFSPFMLYCLSLCSSASRASSALVPSVF